jgi:hypothetical protein
MAKKNDIEGAVLAAFQEMIGAGLPVKEFDPHENKDGTLSFVWRFKRGLTPSEVKKAKQISSKWINAKYSAHSK